MPHAPADLTIIGGGIVGLATAYRFLQRFPKARLNLLEKENQLARHQSGHNSGVLHSGIYYRPGSLRAVNCRAGKRALEAFCQEEEIPFSRCGKVIVATDEEEIPRLEALLDRGRENGIDCARIDPEELHEIEPQARGLAAIHVPETGIVDYPAVCRRLGERITEAGGAIHLGQKLLAITQSPGQLELAANRQTFTTRRLVNCAGLYSDKIARMAGADLDLRVIPFRGEFFEIRASAANLVRGLIYPVPDPRFPFLGVHFTRTIAGGLECGPNAVFAFAREGYRNSSVNPRELVESLAYPGFLRLAARYWRTGAAEMYRSLSKTAFLRALRRLVPAVQYDDLVRPHAGVRAQALGRDGRLIDDFVIRQNGPAVHVLNAPSPAATSALNIGQLIVDRLSDSAPSQVTNRANR